MQLGKSIIYLDDDIRYLRENVQNERRQVYVHVKKGLSRELQGSSLARGVPHCQDFRLEIVFGWIINFTKQHQVHIWLSRQ